MRETAAATEHDTRSASTSERCLATDGATATEHSTQSIRANTATMSSTQQNAYYSSDVTEQSNLQALPVVRHGRRYYDFHRAHQHCFETNICESSNDLATDSPSKSAPALVVQCHLATPPKPENASGLATEHPANVAPDQRAVNSDNSQSDRIATEHPKILLRVEDIQTLVAQKGAYPQLHKQARDALSSNVFCRQKS